jgi:hypothetical protein
MEKGLVAFREFHEEDRKRQFEAGLKAAKEARVEAMKEQDWETVDKLDDQIAALKAEEKEPPPAPVAPPKVLPAVQAFMDDPKVREWMEKSEGNGEKLVATASYFNALGFRGEALLEQVRESLDLDAPPFRRPSKTEEGSRGGEAGGGGGRSGYNALTAEEKKACARFEEELVGPKKAYKTLAEWRSHYAKSLGY